MWIFFSFFLFANVHQLSVLNLLLKILLSFQCCKSPSVITVLILSFLAGKWSDQWNHDIWHTNEITQLPVAYLLSISREQASSLIWNKGTVFDANTLSQLFFLVCIRFDSSLFTNKVGLTHRGSTEVTWCLPWCQIQDSEWDKTKFATRRHTRFGCLPWCQIQDGKRDKTKFATRFGCLGMFVSLSAEKQTHLVRGHCKQVRFWAWQLKKKNGQVEILLICQTLDGIMLYSKVNEAHTHSCWWYINIYGLTSLYAGHF